jgi:anhydro-N-acetylmuramic acid kinase
MSELYIGLMSGTSADGIDAALVDFGGQYPKLLEGLYQPYSDELRGKIIQLCQKGDNEIERLGELDVLLAEEFANLVNELLDKHALSADAICGIGSHGQTIRHHPQRFTLQVGDPNIIAARTGITTIADFRRKDMALGGQAAPLVPAFHHYVFATSQSDRAIVNIGGIANVTLLSKDSPGVIGFDTGPGNTLLDAWIFKHQQKRCDEKGNWARTGMIHPALLNQLLNDAYFSLPAPKSTGREYFNLNWLSRFLSSAISPQDVQATLLELTAQSIVNAIKTHFTQGEILICGGGVHNEFLMERLAQLAKANFTLASTQQYGIHPNWVEAMAFAFLAKQTLTRQYGNLPSVTGAKKAAILGGIYYA